jgi:copper oxidase (laccase) domain-containing protein
VAGLAALGARPGGISARVGPAICAACYEVSAEVGAALDRAAPGSAAGADGAWRADIRAAAALQLRRAGVHDVFVDDRCTAHDPDLFSHRRDGRTGRQGMLVVLDPS